MNDTEKKNHIRNLLNLEWFDLDQQRMLADPGSQQEADLIALQTQIEEELASL